MCKALCEVPGPHEFTATVPIGPLASEPSYTLDVALKRQKMEKKKRKRKENTMIGTVNQTVVLDRTTNPLNSF